MENSIEEAIKIMEHWVEYEKNNKEKINRADELINIQETILLNYKRVLKENEELNEKILDNAGIYQLGFKDGEESYIKKVKDKIEELKEKIENLPAEVYPIIEDDLQIKIEVLEELLESEE